MWNDRDKGACVMLTFVPLRGATGGRTERSSAAESPPTIVDVIVHIRFAGGRVYIYTL